MSTSVAGSSTTSRPTASPLNSPSRPSWVSGVGRTGGASATRGLFVGGGREAFERAAALSARVNVKLTGEAARTIVCYLDPAEFRSTWLGNKAIYRARLAMADGGRLIILAPGVSAFGEDPRIDATIRRYGYRGATRTAELVASGELAVDLAGAAHLAHGSTEGRFTVIYAAGGLTRAEVESVGYEYEDPRELMRRYAPSTLADGWNERGGERFYFIRNPALGLWSNRIIS